jgi:hypothetical protein
MTTQADWIVVTGFLLAAFGVGLRIVIMMHSAEVPTSSANALAGGDLVRAYRVSHPRSRLPWLMRASLAVGLVLLIAGFLLEMR